MMRKCIYSEEGIQLLRDIHSGICGSHSSRCCIIGKVFRHGFYWPTVTPTFCIIKFGQARSALGCILEFSLKKILSQFNWPKVAFMPWNVSFSKNP
jgi:hypothetical protein